MKVCLGELINEGHIALETGFALKSGEERTPTRKTTYKAIKKGILLVSIRKQNNISLRTSVTASVRVDLLTQHTTQGLKIAQKSLIVVE